MEILDDLHTLLSVDISKDPVLNLYIRKAVTLITNYLNAAPTIPPVDIATAYPDAVIEYTVLCYNKRGNEGVKQASQGSRSQTYEDSLPSSVKALLPLPYVKMRG